MKSFADTTKAEWDRIDAALVPLHDAGLTASALWRLLDVTVDQLGAADARKLVGEMLDLVMETRMDPLGDD